MSCDVITPIEPFLTEDEVAQLLRIAPSNLRAIRARNEIPFYRIGFNRGRVVYAKDDVQRFLEKRRSPATAEAA
jgi:excisionase family DNA binding protein